MGALVEALPLDVRQGTRIGKGLAQLAEPLIRYRDQHGEGALRFGAAELRDELKLVLEGVNVAFKVMLLNGRHVAIDVQIDVCLFR